MNEVARKGSGGLSEPRWYTPPTRMLPASCATPEASCVLFSAYVEGSHFNKLLDIQNRCSDAITLTDYELVNCGNGCTQWEHTSQLQPPTPTLQLAPMETWRSADSQIAILPSGSSYAADQTKGYLSNGNDLYGLKHKPSGAVIDVIGPVFPGASVPTGWAVGGVARATKDHSLIRKSTVLHGNCGDWAPSAGTNTTNSEWLVFPQDTVMSKDGDTTATPITSSGDEGASGSTGGGSGGGGSTGGSSSPSSCPGGALPDCPAPPSMPPVLGADRRPDKSKLTIATWNAEWLFDGVCDPAASPWDGGSDCVGFDSGLNACDAAGADLKTQRAAEVIERFGADVINLVEVEGCDELHRCAAHLNSSALLDNSAGAHPYEAYVLTGTDTYLKQQVGLLTRLTPSQPLEREAGREDYPIDSASQCGAMSHHGPGTSDLSKHYLARLMVEGLADPSSNSLYGTLAVLGIHFKAFPTDPYSCNKREAQAKIAQGLLTTALSETPYVVAMGDFNDFDGDPCCLDAADSTPRSRVLRMLKDPYNTGVDALHSVAASLPKAQRYSAWWDHAPKNGVDDGPAEHSMIDHMLVSTELFEKLVEVRIDHTHQPMDVSDHWPVIATFQFAPPQPPPAQPLPSPDLVASLTPPPPSPSPSLLPAAPPEGTDSLRSPEEANSLPLFGGLAVGIAALVAIGRLWRTKGQRPHKKRQSPSDTFASAMSSSSSVSASSGGEWELNDAAKAAATLDSSNAAPLSVGVHVNQS